jgi:hypothetical protein
MRKDIEKIENKFSKKSKRIKMKKEEETLDFQYFLETVVLQFGMHQKHSYSEKMSKFSEKKGIKTFGEKYSWLKFEFRINFDEEKETTMVIGMKNKNLSL